MKLEITEAQVKVTPTLSWSGQTILLDIYNEYQATLAMQVDDAVALAGQIMDAVEWLERCEGKQ